jgi:hypothetical protein
VKLLTQNSDLRKTGIYGWTLPAHYVTLSSGERFNTCPSAGICAAFCYAKHGTFKFKNVLKSHTEKLELVLNNRAKWKEMMLTELANKKYIGKYVRIHDSGDFFSEDYAIDWIDIAIYNPNITFYTYTKEVKLFKERLLSHLPKNFIVIYSYGGKEDYLIDRELDRHSDVFDSYDKMIEAGYNDIADDDKQAAIHPNRKVGLYRNNIPVFIKKMKNYTFSEWQEGKPKNEKPH